MAPGYTPQLNLPVAAIPFITNPSHAMAADATFCASTVANAPPEVVEEEREKLERYGAELEELSE